MGTHGPILRPAGDEAAPAPQAGWQDNGNVTAMGSENAAGMDRCPGLLLLLLILLAVRQMQLLISNTESAPRGRSSPGSTALQRLLVL